MHVVRGPFPVSRHDRRHQYSKEWQHLLSGLRLRCYQRVIYWQVGVNDSNGIRIQFVGPKAPLHTNEPTAPYTKRSEIQISKCDRADRDLNPGPF